MVGYILNVLPTENDTKLRSDIVVEIDSGDGETGERGDGEKMNVLPMNAIWYEPMGCTTS